MSRKHYALSLLFIVILLFREGHETWKEEEVCGC